MLAVRIPSGLALFPSLSDYTDAGVQCATSNLFTQCVLEQTAGPNGEYEGSTLLAAAAWDSPPSIELCVTVSTDDDVNPANDESCLTLPVVTTPECDLVLQKGALYPGLIRYEITVTWKCQSDHPWWTIGNVRLVEDLPGDQPVEIIQVVVDHADCVPMAGFQTSISCNFGYKVWSPSSTSETITIFLSGSANCTNVTTIDPANLIKEMDETNNSASALAFPC